MNIEHRLTIFDFTILGIYSSKFNHLITSKISVR